MSYGKFIELNCKFSLNKLVVTISLRTQVFNEVFVCIKEDDWLILKSFSG
jgi:hypothetical protein